MPWSSRWSRAAHLLSGAPFSSLGRLRRRLVYGAAGVGFVGIGVPLANAERRMKATGGPGIVGLELAGPWKVDGILEKWGDDGKKAARTSLLLDQVWPVTAQTKFALLTIPLLGVVANIAGRRIAARRA